MVHEGIYATSAECITKLGDNYPSTAVDEAKINDFSLMAEGFINTISRKVFATDISGFGSLPAGGKGLLIEAASSYVGIMGLNHKPTGEDGAMARIEYEDRINVLRDSLLRALSLLRDQKVVLFIANGS